MHVVVSPRPGLIKVVLIINLISTDIKTYTYMFGVYDSLESYLLVFRIKNVKNLFLYSMKLQTKSCISMSKPLSYAQTLLQ